MIKREQLCYFQVILVQPAGKTREKPRYTRECDRPVFPALYGKSHTVNSVCELAVNNVNKRGKSAHRRFSLLLRAITNVCRLV